jgi:hypothetical protein
MRVVGESVKRSLVAVLILGLLFLLSFRVLGTGEDDVLWVEATGSPIELAIGQPSTIAFGHAVGMLHQFRCVELLSQGPAVAGSPPG